MKNWCKSILFLMSLTLSLSLGLSPSSFAEQPADVEFMTEVYPPYNFKAEDGSPAGIFVDILVQAFKDMGVEKTKKDIFVYPWPRAYALAQMPNQNNAIFAMTRTPSREKLFRWVGPVTSNKIGLFCHKKKSVQIKTLADLNKYTYVVIRGDIAGIKLRAMNVKRENIKPLNNFTDLVDGVKYKRVDCFAYGENVALWLIKSRNLEADRFKVAYRFDAGQLYYAFNLAIENKAFEAYKKAIMKIIKNKKSMDTIFKRYR